MKYFHESFRPLHSGGLFSIGYVSVLSLLFASFTLGMLFTLSSQPNRLSSPTRISSPVVKTQEKVQRKPFKQFVYVTQNEFNPNPQYSSQIVNDQSDLVTLTYKKPSLQPNTIFRPNTSWASGRNELFYEVIRRENEQGWQYKYIIFVDGDLFLSCKIQNCWRLLENFLLEYEPALGSINYGAYGNAPVSTAYYTEPYLTAIHVEARNTLLPYDTFKDSVNWNSAPIILMAKAVTHYINHVLVMSGITILNTHHTNYPKEWFGHYWDVDDKIESIVPEELMCNYVKPKPKHGSKVVPFDAGDPIFSPGVVKKKNRSYSKHCSIPNKS